MNNLQLGQNIAQSGFTNNYLHHEEELRRQYLLQQLENCESSDTSASCKAKNTAIQIEINELDARDKERNKALLACNGERSIECAQVFTDFNRAQQAWRNEATMHANFANSDLYRNNGGEFGSYNEFLLDSGIYLSVDPVTFLDTGEPRLFNRYAYAFNDPINMWDPDGEQASSVVPRLKPPAPVSTRQSPINPVPGSSARGCDSQGCGDFGASRAGGTRSHDGFDLLASAGDSVVAAVDGTVKLSVPKVGSSLDIVKVNDGNGFEVETFYVSPSVTNGQTVSQGDNIGTVQDLSTEYPSSVPNHVHVEVTINNQNVDPTTELPIP